MKKADIYTFVFILAVMGIVFSRLHVTKSRELLMMHRHGVKTTAVVKHIELGRSNSYTVVTYTFSDGTVKEAELAYDSDTPRHIGQQLEIIHHPNDATIVVAADAQTDLRFYWLGNIFLGIAALLLVLRLTRRI